MFSSGLTGVSFAQQDQLENRTGEAAKFESLEVRTMQFYNRSKDNGTWLMRSLAAR
jgi:hypothetical protein